MNQPKNLTSYEQRLANRLIDMQHFLVAAGMSKEAATKRIIRDLEKGNSEIKPSFVKLVLNQ